MEARDRNLEIGRLAVARGMATRVQVDECMRAFKEGRADSLDVALLDRGYITSVQRDVLLREVTPPEEGLEAVGGYQLIKLIGKGGMGSVYRARQMSLERIVALKVLNRHLAANPTYRERFHREARAAATFNHPNIVRAIDAGEDNGVLFFAMELVDGRNVSTLLREEGIFPEERALDVGRQIAMALGHAARKGIIHRDIKPENILIERDQVAKLTDLGLAKFTGAEQRRITQVGMAMGTPFYISPEQIRLAEDLDIRADLYALGATLFHMVCGRPPFLAESPTTVVSMHLSSPVPDPRTYNPALSPGCAALIQKMLAKERKDRFQTPEELLDAFNALRAPAPGSFLLSAAPAVSESEDPSGVSFGMIMAVVTLAALAGLVYFLVFPPGRSGGEGDTNWTAPDGGTSPIPPAIPPRAGKEPPPLAPAETKTGPPVPVPPATPDHELRYRDMEAYRAAHPEDFAGILERLNAIQKEFPGTTSALLCAKTAGYVQRALDTKADQALHGAESGIVPRARRLKEMGRFSDGLALFDDFPEPLRAGGWEARLEREKREYLVEGRREVEILLRRAREAAGRKKYQQALDLLQKARDTGVPGYETKIVAEETGIRGLRADRLFQSFVAGLYQAATENGLLDAEATLARWAKDPTADALKDDFTRVQAVLDDCRLVLGARDKALQDRIGRPVDLRLKNGRRLVGTLKTALPREGSVVLKGMGGAASPFVPAEIGIRSLTELTGLSGARGWRAVAGFQFLLLGDTEAARQALANCAGPPDPWLQRALEQVEEETVGALLRGVEIAKARDTEQAYKLLVRILTQYRHTAAFASSRGRVEGLLEETGQALGSKSSALQAGLFGKITEASQGRLKLVWNFDHRDQLRDWEGEKGSFRVEDGALFQTTEKGGTIFLPFRWKKFTLDADVDGPAGPEGIVGFVFHYQRASQYFVFGLRLGRGHARVRAVLLHPDLKGRDFLMVEDSGTDLDGFDHEIPHRLRLLVDGDDYKGYVDGTPVFATRVAVFGEGRVGLRAERPCTFSSVAVLGERSD